MSNLLLGKSPFLTRSLSSTPRLTFLILCAFIGLSVGFLHLPHEWLGIGLAGIFGGSLGCLVLWIESQMTSFSPSIILGGSLGLLVGMIALSLAILAQQIDILGPWSFVLWGLVPLILFPPYLGVALGLHFSRVQVNSWTSSSPTIHLPVPYTHRTMNTIPKLLDSSAIIDGRIIHLRTTGFLEGPLLIPKCILKEIHLLADSENSSKRTKGKRGLAILSELRQFSHPNMMIVDDQVSRASTVDHQLIAIAKYRKAKIVTNDWNLAQVATLEEVTCLNVNELTYQLRPLVLPGERVRVFINKEGQGINQGIAHLDDGTMVVVDQGSHLIGKTVNVIVTKFMQTSTGRMIFVCPEEQEPIMRPTPKPSLQNVGDLQNS